MNCGRGTEKKTFSVTFDDSNGTIITKEYAKTGVLITEPDAPYRRGTIFEGWYVAENGYTGNKKWDFNNDILTGDTTLIAKWKMSDTFFEPDLNAATRAKGSNLRIMSFNILSDYYNNKPRINGRDKLIIDMLNRYTPDVIGMQEVTDKWYELLNEQLGKYRFVNKDNNKVKNIETNYSTIAYNTEKYEVIKYDQIPYLMNDNVNCRNVTWAIFKEKSNGKQFIVTSTHWDLSSGGRLNNADQLKKIVLELQEDYNVPIFSTGDYNTGEFSNEYNYYIENSRFIDSKYNAKRKGLACTTSHRGDGTGSREDYSSGYWKLGVVSFRLYNEKSIDHIFCSPKAEILYYDTIVDKYILDASDHCPIYIDAAI